MPNTTERNLSTRANGHAVFAAEALRDLRTTGAIAPSSLRLARALTAPIARSTLTTLSILEVGAGTGSLSRAIAARIGPDDTLTCVERNPRLARHLRRTIGTDPALRAHSDRIVVHECDVVEVSATELYDVVVVGLPFANFTAHETRRICRTLDGVLAPGGCITYFSYLGAAAVDRFAGQRNRRHRLGSARALADFRSGFRQDRVTVWTNLPPAYAWTLTKPVQTCPVPSADAGNARPQAVAAS
ncbi:class I SAM-dependent methyltransferase [Prescottella agglutinans]|uniref:Phosphatidylethanolamine/phosphatidyl-N-methylethanolamine N-methyltransferase n=1 Tax=Prescottella agglutinans TaxID=1644129 RepID=A0ABT6MGL5_9NOCA|nr:methyltransferase domain-containing protein [Prescottella agglutinans]MDH6283471.1 phosphatidylethanolamine/phosphatidyl-N-methylethanolamine N-methyltransferase [Prescottella agglutinans]